MRATAAVLIVVIGVTLSAQNAPDAFEVASVSENKSASSVSSNSGPRPGPFTIVNKPLRFIVLEAFGLLDHQLIGAPEWTNTVAYDITATFPDGSVSERDWRPMLQRLLVDRFGLAIHRDTWEVPSYDLVLSRKDGVLGKQLVRTDGSCDKPSSCTLLVNRQSLTARTQPIQKITPALQSLTGRPVIDRTGLTGTFDIDLKWSVTGGDGPSIFTALQEQLGLKWNRRKSVRGHRDRFRASSDARLRTRKALVAPWKELDVLPNRSRQPERRSPLSRRPQSTVIDIRLSPHEISSDRNCQQ